MTRGTIKTAERIRNNMYEDKVRDIFPTWTAKVKWLIEHHAQMSAMVADCELRQIFQPIDDDAKKGQVLLDVGLPFAVIGAYNIEDELFSFAYFCPDSSELKIHSIKNPLGYMPMPVI